MPRQKGPAPTLPSQADDFLRDAAQRSRTAIAYPTALVNFQTFAEATKLTQKKVPLPSDALELKTLADYYSWLKRHGYRNASIRLYLSAVGQYLLLFRRALSAEDGGVGLVDEITERLGLEALN